MGQEATSLPELGRGVVASRHQVTAATIVNGRRSTCLHNRWWLKECCFIFCFCRVVIKNLILLLLVLLLVQRATELAERWRHVERRRYLPWIEQGSRVLVLTKSSVILIHLYLGAWYLGRSLGYEQETPLILMLASSQHWVILIIMILLFKHAAEEHTDGGSRLVRWGHHWRQRGTRCLANAKATRRIILVMILIGTVVDHSRTVNQVRLH